jgi:hypothetical protein
MMVALVVLVFVAMNYANTTLALQLASDEFSSSKQFMQSVDLQIDNVAWTIGRTATIDFTAKYGQIAFVPNVINYTFEVYNGSSWRTLYNSTTGMLMYKIPVSSYSLGNNSFDRILPEKNGSILQWNASASIAQVFSTQKIPMNDGSYSRIVVVPITRVLNSTLITGGTYYKFYLPTLVGGQNPHLSQSVTLIGNNLSRVTSSGTITQVRINATALAAPSSPPGFNSSFFNFDHTSETVTIPSGSLVELYSGTASVSIGMVS